MKFFISYTMLDKEINRCFLMDFSNKLKKIGEVYIDLIDNDSDDKQTRVLNELDNCDFLILIESKHIYQSKWVNIEIERAKLNQIPIIKIPIVVFIYGRELCYVESKIKECSAANIVSH